MSFQLVVTDNASDVATSLARTLRTHLAAGENVLWLVPGGSALKVVIEVAQLLVDCDCQNLTVSLTDERYGPVGSADSNWEQLRQLGFEITGATLHPVLTGVSRDETTTRHAAWLQTALADSDFSLGFFGIGPDGHTAGILPGSPAVNAPSLAASYVADPFERITMTPRAITGLHEAVAYATGEPKRKVLSELVHKDLSLEAQPSQVLKSVRTTTLFTDLKDV